MRNRVVKRKNDVCRKSNASRFISAIGNTCPLPGGFADVEVVNSNDPAMWGAATESNQVNNNLVIQGFEDYVAQHAVCKFLLGVYSNTSSWESITGSASPSDVDASWFWLSHFGATLPALSSDKTEIENTFQMDVFSWQYATDACEDGIFFIQALLRAADASVGRIDKWTSTDPSIVC